MGCFYILNYTDSKYICKTCQKHILHGKVPKLASNENLRFLTVPDFIQNLSSLEERMVSPYIPFMQIRALQPYALNSQLSLKGSILNIQTDINEMIQFLPRNFDEMSIVQIKLKRHIEHQTDYMFETIKPSKICKALEFLIHTPLYVRHDIKVNNNFFSNYEKNSDDNINFIIDEDEQQTNNNNDNTKNNKPGVYLTIDEHFPCYRARPQVVDRGTASLGWPAVNTLNKRPRTMESE